MEERLTIVADELQAEMVRSMLDAHGIASVVRRPALGEIQWGAINVGMGGAREVIVAASDLAAAQQLLDAPGDATPAEASRDLALEQRSRDLASGFSLTALLLFGVPLIAAALLWLASTLELLG